MYGSGTNLLNNSLSEINARTLIPVLPQDFRYNSLSHQRFGKNN